MVSIYIDIILSSDNGVVVSSKAKFQLKYRDRLASENAQL